MSVTVAETRHTRTMSGAGGSWLWGGVACLLAAPMLLALLFTMWRMPYPISEAVALFEDVARFPWTRFLVPDTSYYRPLFQWMLMAVWDHASSLDAKLALIKLAHIVPLFCLVPLFIRHLAPRSALEAMIAVTAVAVIVGSPGFRDNLEIPLSYTAVAMPLSVLVWMLVEREPRFWRSAAVFALVVTAVGFKEQGLVLVPVVILAWLTRAPGATRGLSLSLVAFSLAYVAMRLQWRTKWPMFEQEVGLWFSSFEPPEAVARFGDFPYFLYAYSSLSTIANVLFSEPTRGIFYLVRDAITFQLSAWGAITLLSAAGLTSVIAWWGRQQVRDALRSGWSAESRAVVLLGAALLASGALSFNYSRDRLGGMAVVFYAACAFLALRAASARVITARHVKPALAIGLLLLAGAWHLRALGTLELVRRNAWRNQMEWLADLPARRLEFAERQVYLDIMESMVEQGTDPSTPQPTRYPLWWDRTILPRP